MTTSYKVIFDLRCEDMGVPLELFSTEAKSLMESDFVTLYNAYCNASNSELDALNNEWDRLHPDITRMEDGSQELYAYGNYMKEAFQKTCDVINSRFKGANIWTGYIEMDGPNPIFAARVTEKPEWTMRFMLEPV